MASSYMASSYMEAPYMVAPYMDDILSVLPPVIAEVIEKSKALMLPKLEEIRLRAEKPVMLETGNGCMFLSVKGEITPFLPSNPLYSTKNHIGACITALCMNSVYAMKKEIRSGYITLPGGHRVGFCGKAVIENDNISCIRDFSGINIRITREIKGCSKKLEKYIRNNGKVYNTLIISPPQCGKTTILRDLARILGRNFKISIIDERSEIAGCVEGVPSFDIGLKTDVMDGCPKCAGIEILIRSMSPEIIITDELGNDGDKNAVISALNAGVAIVASAHGDGANIKKANRQELRTILSEGVFDRLIILSRLEGPGTLEEVYNGKDMSVIYRRCENVV